MAEEIFAPGVTRTEWEWCHTTTYEGTLEALTAAGLIPEGVVPPLPWPRCGIHWKDKRGRVCRLSREGRCLRVKATKEEVQGKKASTEADRASAERLAFIERSLGTWSDHKSQFSYMIAKCMDATMAELNMYLWKSSAHRGPWTLSEQDRERLWEFRIGFIACVQGLEATFDPQWRPRLELERAMLSTDDRPGDEATALLARIARG